MLDHRQGSFTGVARCIVVASVLALAAIAPGTAWGADGTTIVVDPAKREWAEKLLWEVLNGPKGPKLFAAIDLLATKARDSDAADRDAILAVAISTMNDKGRPVKDRYPCCDLIRRIGDERGVPDLVQVLLRDESDVMRMQAAHALGYLSWNPAARDALEQASSRETSEKVRKMIAGWLARPAPAKPGAAGVPRPAKGVEELAPSGPPQRPPGPGRPVAKPLPWPFPGDYKAQNIVYNYQYCADAYIHLALDFLHPAGTPVTAVDSGYVAAIRSQAPHRDDFFIVAADRGANRGWCYTHMDPRSFTFKEGDRIEQGQLLGSLTEFSLDGGKTRGDHLHLGYVTFSKDPSGRVNTHKPAGSDLLLRLEGHGNTHSPATALRAGWVRRAVSVRFLRRGNGERPGGHTGRHIGHRVPRPEEGRLRRPRGDAIDQQWRAHHAETRARSPWGCRRLAADQAVVPFSQRDSELVQHEFLLPDAACHQDRWRRHHHAQGRGGVLGYDCEGRCRQASLA